MSEEGFSIAELSVRFEAEGADEQRRGDCLGGEGGFSLLPSIRRWRFSSAEDEDNCTPLFVRSSLEDGRNTPI